MFWLLGGSSSVPDYDTYTVYPGDASTYSLVKDQAARMRSLDTQPVPAPPPPAPESPPFPGMPTAPPATSTEEFFAQ
jgi:hypothetical protein